MVRGGISQASSVSQALQQSTRERRPLGRVCPAAHLQAGMQRSQGSHVLMSRRLGHCCPSEGVTPAAPLQTEGLDGCKWSRVHQLSTAPVPATGQVLGAPRPSRVQSPLPICRHTSSALTAVLVAYSSKSRPGVPSQCYLVSRSARFRCASTHVGLRGTRPVVALEQRPHTAVRPGAAPRSVCRLCGRAELCYKKAMPAQGLLSGSGKSCLDAVMPMTATRLH